MHSNKWEFVRLGSGRWKNKQWSLQELDALGMVQGSWLKWIEAWIVLNTSCCGRKWFFNIMKFHANRFFCVADEGGISEPWLKYHQTKVDKNEKNSLEFVSVVEAYLQRMTSVKMVKNLYAPHPRSSGAALHTIKQATWRIYNDQWLLEMNVI